MSEFSPVFEMRGIVKRYGTHLALDGADFTLRPGEIHALLGENGAGKSTLMNIGCGLVAPTEGRILLHGQPVEFHTPREATRAGIGMVHQHFLLVPAFTVLENLVLASQSRGWSLENHTVQAAAQTVMGRLGWTIPLNIRITDLPVGTQQRVEILKALLGDARVLLLDEPTAVLAPGEVEELLAVLRALRSEGRALVFVSHKLKEVMAVCDRVSVLRQGRMAGTVAVAETDPEDLARRMVGETGAAASLIADPGPVSRVFPVSKRQDQGGEQPVLAVEMLSTAPAPDAVALHDLSFTLAPGEILGVAGVDGNGQSELAQALTGLRPWTHGRVRLHGKTVSRLRPQDMEPLRVALIPPDRQTQGLALRLSIEENLLLEAIRLPRFRRGPFLKRHALRAFATQLVQDFDIRAGSLQAPVQALSGGNQQKVVIARALWRKPALLVAVSPTRGLDVGATEYVHRRLRERQAEGGAILLLSTELDEILALSSRIAVLYGGRLVGIVPAGTRRETLGLMMGGKKQEVGS